MIHKRPKYSVERVEDLEELCRLLTEKVWAGCSGFAWGNLVLLNDSMNEEGEQIYAVFREGYQVDSLLVSSRKVLASSLAELDAHGSKEAWGADCPLPPTEPPEQHQSCPWCGPWCGPWGQERS